MLTPQQMDILKLLTDFKCLRYSHIKKIMVAKYKSTDMQLSIILKQLRYLSKISYNGGDDGFVMLPGRNINPDVIRAFDVVMELTNGTYDYVNPGCEPITLILTVKTGSEASDFSKAVVIIAEPFSESYICERVLTIDRESTVIFILSNMEQQRLLKIKNKCYYAMQGGDGRYKFYKAANSPQKSEEV